MEENNSTEPENGAAIIPEEDFREAIAACCKDPRLNRFFQQAPQGAKLFIGLGFYSTHFGDKVDKAQYAECLAEIEPALSSNDLKYLIRFERDRETKSYLKELLARREKEEASSSAEVPVADVEGVDTEVAKLAADAAPGQTPERTPSIASGSSAARLNSILDSQLSPPKSSFAFLKAAAAFTLLACGAAFVYFGKEKWGGRPDVPQGGGPQHVRELPPDDDTNIVSTLAAVATNAPSKIESQPVAVVEAVESRTNDVAVVAPSEDELAEAGLAVVSDAEIGKSKKPKRSLHGKQPVVVFTDGRKIVRRPGMIEVPRRFSCTGAGIKPFWVYDQKADVEAAKERAARAEWEALCKLAREGENGGDANGH